MSSLTITATYKASLTKLAMCDTGKDSEKRAWGRHADLILQTITISPVFVEAAAAVGGKVLPPSPIAQENNDKQLNPYD